ncbi:MAG TPA: exodeoxyribonuclease VII small subunit [Candidatus Gallacutalibacter pullistercoris]|nr:exodeoxyribonuclease VII small subunit [Candidatus Gallacutalibacter pullistercoris]
MNRKMTYEEALGKLKEVVTRLESGEETLDASLKLFEEGAKLSAFCYEKLQNAEQKITEITKLEQAAE